MKRVESRFHRIVLLPHLRPSRNRREAHRVPQQSRCPIHRPYSLLEMMYAPTRLKLSECAFTALPCGAGQSRLNDSDRALEFSAAVESLSPVRPAQGTPAPVKREL